LKFALEMTHAFFLQIARALLACASCALQLGEMMKTSTPTTRLCQIPHQVTFVGQIGSIQHQPRLGIAFLQ